MLICYFVRHATSSRRKISQSFLIHSPPDQADGLLVRRHHQSLLQLPVFLVVRYRYLLMYLRFSFSLQPCACCRLFHYLRVAACNRIQHVHGYDVTVVSDTAAIPSCPHTPQPSSASRAHPPVRGFPDKLRHTAAVTVRITAMGGRKTGKW